MATVRESWERIVVWYCENALRAETASGPVWQLEGDPSDWTPPPGASEASIALAEQAMGLQFPDDLRASYLLHDGSGDTLFPWGFVLLGLEEMVRDWRTLRRLFEKENWPAEPDDPIRPVHWDALWVPAVSNESGDYHFVDLDPAPGGTVGQVICFHHEVGPIRVLANGFGEWLGGYADQLEAGIYYYDPDEGWVRSDDRE